MSKIIKDNNVQFIAWHTYNWRNSNIYVEQLKWKETTRQRRLKRRRVFATATSVAGV